MSTAPGEPARKLCVIQIMVPISISCLRCLSSSLKAATVVKVVPIQPKIESNPANEKTVVVNIITRKSHITLFDVVSMLLKYRETETNPNSAAVQWPNNIKWHEINTVETTKQINIFFRSLNWKEIRSTRTATPISICDRTKFDNIAVPQLKI